MDSFNNNDLLMIEDMLDLKQEPTTILQQATPVRNPKRLREIDTNMTIEPPIESPSTDKIEKRNARERNRVRVVNQEFEKLRRVVQGADYCRRRIIDLNEESGRKLSKLKILRLSIEYIQFLTDLLTNDVSKENTCFQCQEMSTSDQFSIDDDFEEFSDLPILMFHSQNFF